MTALPLASPFLNSKLNSASDELFVGLIERDSVGLNSYTKHTGTLNDMIHV